MKHYLYCLLLFGNVCTFAQTPTTAEKLGYPRDAKLLIIHADDLGVSHSENEASFKAMEQGSVNSGSIMVPCPWFPEVAAWARQHPQADLGLHLTLTAEWKYYKWGTVASRGEVQTLLTEQAFLPEDPGFIARQARLDEVEKELRAQIERARQFGIDFTHFDTHMGTLVTTVDLAKLYIRLGQEYKVPILMHRGMAKAMLNLNIDDYLKPNDVVLDQIYIAQPEHYRAGMNNFYASVLRDLKPGLNCLLLHAAYDNAEMQAVTIDHPDYGAAWRQADFDFFTSETCRKLLKEQNIQLVTWREIRDKIVRK
jgi:hypothetical protein